MDTNAIKLVKAQYTADSSTIYNLYAGKEGEEELLADATYGQYFRAADVEALNNCKHKYEIDLEVGYYLCTQNRGYTDYVKVADEEALVIALISKQAFIFAQLEEV